MASRQIDGLSGAEGSAGCSTTPRPPEIAKAHHEMQRKEEEVVANGDLKELYEHEGLEPA